MPASAGALALAAIVSPLGWASGLADSTTVLLTNNVLQGVSSLTPTGDTSPSAPIGLGVGLMGANPLGEDAYLAGEYDPSSSLYGQYLDPADYEAQFGVPADRYNNAVSWLGSTGLRVQSIPGSSEYVLASGSVAQVEGLLNVQVKNFLSNGKAFYANVNAPTVPAALQVIGVTGLNSIEGPRLSPQLRTQPGTTPQRPSTISPSADTNLTNPPDLWSIYNQPANNKGEGQQMAIFGWGTTNNTIPDLRQFEREYSLPGAPVTISYYGTQTAITDSGGEGEWNIDTQASTGMAPNVVGEHLYFGKAGTDADLIAAYHAWAADKQGPLQGSSSFGGCEQAPGTNGLQGSPGQPTGVLIAGNPNQALYERVLRKIVAEGRTMFASTGDTGSGCPVVSLELNGATLVPTPMMNYPAVSSYVTAVGGTVLYFNDPTATTSASRALEYGWTHGGGGSSDFIAAGAYQQKMFPPLLFHCATGSQGNPYPPPPPLCRGIPDVAAQSGDIISNGYTVTMSGNNDSAGGGTSLSSPLWLGMWTRIQAASKHAKGNGFADATIYRIADDSTKYARDFFDIGGTSTDTAVSCNGAVPVYNCSHVGWDYQTGWGTPDVTNLMLDVDGKTAPTNVTTPNPVPPPPPDLGNNGGTTCPGPQIVDPAGDAPNNYPGGDGSNMNNLDIINAKFASPNATTLQITLALKDLEAPPPPANMISAYWTVYWTYNGVEYYAQATSNGTGAAALWDFSQGTFSGGRFNSANVITGTANPGVYTGGTAGTLVFQVPLAGVGNPPAGTSLTGTFADTHGSITVAGTGIYWTAEGDRA
ncbi:MAG: S53 family peptidase, partial [Candidatus Dormibacteraceae bacterium]